MTAGILASPASTAATASAGSPRRALDQPCGHAFGIFQKRFQQACKGVIRWWFMRDRHGVCELWKKALRPVGKPFRDSSGQTPQ